MSPSKPDDSTNRVAKIYPTRSSRGSQLHSRKSSCVLVGFLVLPLDYVSDFSLLSSSFFNINPNGVTRDPKSLVTFIVGSEGSTKEYLVHKEIACHHSSDLKAAFNSEFIEGSTQTYRLEDVSEASFNFLMQWLYSQSLNLLADDPDHVVNMNDEGEDFDQDMHLVSGANILH